MVQVIKLRSTSARTPVTVITWRRLPLSLSPLLVVGLREHRMMTTDHLAINCVIIDSVDPERLAAFWGGVLRRSIVGRTGPYVWLERVGGLGMGFQETAEPKTGKNRLHLDLASADPVAQGQRIESLGGRRLPEYASGGFLVMADPEGNEFCVSADDRRSATALT